MESDEGVADLAGAGERPPVGHSRRRLSRRLGTSPTAATIPRVGLMHVGTDHIPPSLDTLVARLVELGWIDGPQDALMAKLTAGGRAQSQSSCYGAISKGRGRATGQIRSRHVDVIVAFEDKSIAAAQAATAGPRIGSRWSSFIRPIRRPASWRACRTRAGT